MYSHHSPHVTTVRSIRFISAFTMEFNHNTPCMAACEQLAACCVCMLGLQHYHDKLLKPDQLVSMASRQDFCHVYTFCDVSGASLQDARAGLPV